MADIKIKGTVRPRGNGFEYVVDVAEPGQKRNQKTKYFKTREEAEQGLIEINQKMKLGQKFDGNTTLREVITNYYERQVKTKVRRTTFIMQSTHVKRIIESPLGNKKIDAITHEDIEIFYQNLYEEGLGAGSVRNIAMVLRKTFKYAVSRRYLVFDVAKDVSPGTYKPKRFEIWSTEQVEGFLSAMKEVNELRHAFYCIGFATGMRIGELLALRPSDLYVEKCEIRVERQLKYVRGVGYVEDETKNEVVRTVPVPRVVMDATMGIMDRKTKYLFRQVDGKHWMYPQVLKNFRKDAELLDLPPIRLHDMRHTFATILLSKGIEVTVVAELMGDDVKTVYMTYAHVIPPMRSESVKVIADSFFKSNHVKSVDN